MTMIVIGVEGMMEDEATTVIIKCQRMMEAEEEMVDGEVNKDQEIDHLVDLHFPCPLKLL